MDHLASIAVIVCALLGLVSTCQAQRNRRLKLRLRLALQDGIALWYCESAACDALALIADRTGGGPTSGLAIKRTVRLGLRSQGFVTPSDLATPHQMEGLLRRL